MPMNGVSVFRIGPGASLPEALVETAAREGCREGWIIGIIGSLRDAELAYISEKPPRYDTRRIEGPLEIASGQGSLALDERGETVLHLHCCLANREEAFCGHLKAATVFTTAEVALLPLPVLRRGTDPATGLMELVEGPNWRP